MQAKQAGAEVAALGAALQGEDVQRGLLQWCQLIAGWVLHAATGRLPAQVSLPLDSQPPEQLQMLPEYLLLDMADLIVQLHAMGASVGRDATHVDDIVLLCTALMAAPAYVRNPYTRFKLAQVIHTLTPESRDSRHLRECVPVVALASLL